jgi:hypothetical protein
VSAPAASAASDALAPTVTATRNGTVLAPPATAAARAPAPLFGKVAYPPPSRTYVVQAVSRTYVVAATSRTYVVPAVERTVEVAP